MHCFSYTNASSRADITAVHGNRSNNSSLPSRVGCSNTIKAFNCSTADSMDNKVSRAINKLLMLGKTMQIKAGGVMNHRSQISLPVRRSSLEVVLVTDVLNLKFRLTDPSPGRKTFRKQLKLSTVSLMYMVETVYHIFKRERNI